MTRPLVVLDIVGLTPSMIGQHTPHLASLAGRGFACPLGTVLPAVTCSTQSTLLTGLLPRDHGVVANGWYERELAEIFFWRQSNRLVGGERVYQAPILYVGSTVDPQNRTFPIEVELPNPNGAIKPQMVANMGVTRREVESAVVVPQDALVRVEDGYILYIVVGGLDGQVAEARAVELGPTRRNLVVIEKGVTGGEQLVVVGQRSLAHGDRVNVVESGE